MANYQRKRHNYGAIIAVIIVMLLVLAVAVSAALTQGFTTADPYGWLAKADEKLHEQEDKQQEESKEEQGEENQVEAYVNDFGGFAYGLL